MGAIGPREQVKLAAIADFSRAVQTLHGLTEQFAAARADEDQYAQQMKRRYGRLKRSLMTAGFDQIAQLAGSMESAAGRSGSQRVKARTLREGIASIRFALDTQERVLRSVGSGQTDDDKESTEQPS